MKSPPKWRYWLLISVGLGLVLIQMVMFCMPHKVLMDSRSVRELATAKDLGFAVKEFEVEYGHFPLAESISMKNDMDLDAADSRFISSLLGFGSQHNIKGIAFAEFPMAKNQMGGLIEEKGSFRLVDSEGHPYHIIMDTNRDSRVTNPDLNNSDPNVKESAPEFLPVGVIVFSGGADGVILTGDDITSWRGMPGRSFSSRVRPFLILVIGPILVILGVSGDLLSRRAEKAQPRRSEDSP